MSKSISYKLAYKLSSCVPNILLVLYLIIIVRISWIIGKKKRGSLAMTSGFVVWEIDTWHGKLRGMTLEPSNTWVPSTLWKWHVQCALPEHSVGTPKANGGEVLCPRYHGPCRPISFTLTIKTRCDVVCNIPFGSLLHFTY